MQTKLILGTVQLGIDYGINNKAGKPTKEKCFDILNAAHENQIHTLDTAEAYGSALDIIGEFHKEYPDKTFNIISKFSTNDGSNICLENILKAQLERLNIDSLNSYLFHSFNQYCDNPGFTKELLSLKSDGLIKQLGVSLYTNTELEEVIQDKDIDLIQLPYNLLDNFNKKGELLKAAKDSGKIIHVRSIFLQGLFFVPNNQIPQDLKALAPYLDDLKELSKNFEMSMNEMAISYACSSPLIDNVIIGIDNQEQLIQNVAYSTNPIPPGLEMEINKISVQEAKMLNPVNWKN